MKIAEPLTEESINEIMAEQRRFCATLSDRRRNVAEAINAAAGRELGSLDELGEAVLQDYYYVLGRPERLLLDPAEACLAQRALSEIEAAAGNLQPYTYSLWLATSLMYTALGSQRFLRPDLLHPVAQGPLGAAVAVNVSYVLDDVDTVEQAITFFGSLFGQLADGRVPPGIAETIAESTLRHFRSVELTCSTVNLLELRSNYGRLARQRLLANGCRLDADLATTTTSSQDSRIHLAILASYLDSHGHGLPAFSPLIEGLDHSRFRKTLLCLPSEVPEGWITDHQPELREVFDDVVELDWPDPTGASISRIRALEVDVLFSVDPYDTTLLDRPAEIIYHRVAKKQVTGYFNNATTGIPTMDHIVTAGCLDSPDFAESHFLEQSVYLEALPFCYDFDAYFEVEPEPITRESLGLPVDARVITCGNTILVKLRYEAMEAYMRVLQRVDNAYFALMPGGGSLYHQERIFWNQFVGLLAQQQIDPGRVVIVGDASRNRQFGMVGMADVYLDFFPFAGANSVLDPIFMGTPAVVLDAEYQLRCRQAAAILESIDCGELAAKTIDDYVDLVVRLLTDETFAKETANKLGPDNLRRSQVFDRRDAQQQFSDALEQIHRG